MKNNLHAYYIHEGLSPEDEPVILLHEEKFTEEEFKKKYDNLLEVKKMTESITHDKVDMMDFITATLCDEYGFVNANELICITVDLNKNLIEKSPRDSKEETSA